ncbi:hypothetical protein XU18_3358 [Perkinsela sp. CCAP 1560/4]|nr:hypothetical protein XU18_3358 [Perkinsela sp. CCAP 1560/4]|eukprot:KNH05587.1 hypothetical protein XU18_3358 [Perkinsela sp. CCAP 1560/4]
MVAVWVGRGLPSLSGTSASQGDIWCEELPSLYRQAPTGGVTGVEERVALVDAEIDDMGTTGIGGNVLVPIGVMAVSVRTNDVGCPISL